VATIGEEGLTEELSDQGCYNSCNIHRDMLLVGQEEQRAAGIATLIDPRLLIEVGEAAHADRREGEKRADEGEPSQVRPVLALEDVHHSLVEYSQIQAPRDRRKVGSGIDGLLTP